MPRPGLSARLVARPVGARLLSGRLLGALAVLGAILAILLARPGAASAHPLGNFTTNHYTRIDVTAEKVTLFRVLDLAEIPSFQVLQDVDDDGDGILSDAEAAPFVESTAADLTEGMRLNVGGAATALELESSRFVQAPGEAGLPLFRVELTFRAALPERWHDASPDVTFEDDAYGERTGWREVVVRGGPGVELSNSSVPAETVSDELRTYPGGLGSPLDVREASFHVTPGVGAALPQQEEREDRATRGNPDSSLGRFTDLIARDDLTFGVIVVALLGAVAFGALHALSPGHGKTVVAAYLVGSRGTAKHALLLGLVVTATHTSSVYLIGFITLWLSEYIVPEKLYPWLGVTAGGLILLLGLSLFYGRLRASGLLPQFGAWLRDRAPRAGQRPAMLLATADATAGEHLHDGRAHDHAIAQDHEHARAFAGQGSDPGGHEHGAREHSHDDESHDHDHGDAAPHSHGFGPAHSHRIPGQDGEPVTVRSLIGLGIFGGMIPCPSAIVVMLSAIALHRVAFGLVLIVAFSVGLAAVLTGIGFALVYARTLSERVPMFRRVADRLEHSGGSTRLAVRAFPVVTALAVVGAGGIITLRAFLQM